MPPLPPLNLDFGSNAFSSLGLNGATWGGFGLGDWNVNVSGSGEATQSATSSSSTLLPWLVAAAAVAFVLLKK